ncbi:MAG: hypothetical protein PHV82_04245 [Victivallaceae bacterium]|nr:hypothetical protein [Victivallaceae bacterium]
MIPGNLIPELSRRQRPCTFTLPYPGLAALCREAPTAPSTLSICFRENKLLFFPESKELYQSGSQVLTPPGLWHKTQKDRKAVI